MLLMEFENMFVVHSAQLRDLFKTITLSLCLAKKSFMLGSVKFFNFLLVTNLV